MSQLTYIYIPKRTGCNMLIFECSLTCRDNVSFKPDV